MLIQVVSDEPALVANALGDKGEFAPRRGAEVEEDLPRLGIEGSHRQKGAWVLDIKETLLEAGQMGQRRMILQLKDQILFDPIATEEIVVDIFLSPLLEQFGWIGFQSVNPCKGFGWGIVPGHQL